MNKFLRILITIWELPQTLLAGSMIFFLGRKITGHESFKDARLFYVKKFPGAISLGRFIILNTGYSSDEKTKKHEYGHSLQSLYLGWLYIIIVGLPSIIRAFAWKLLNLTVPLTTEDILKTGQINWDSAERSMQYRNTHSNIYMFPGHPA